MTNIRLCSSLPNDPSKLKKPQPADKDSGENAEVQDASSKSNNQIAEDKTEEESVGIFKRFKDAYKQYGKVMIVFHVATSCVWYGSFVYAASW